jgi:hypothetical protein
VVTQLHQFTRPITLACNQYIQYLLTVANSSVPNRYTYGGYNLGGTNFLHHTIHPSQPMVLHFAPKDPIWSRAYKIPPTILKFKVKKPMMSHSDHMAIYHAIYLHLERAIDLSLVIRLTRRD